MGMFRLHYAATKITVSRETFSQNSEAYQKRTGVANEKAATTSVHAGSYPTMVPLESQSIGPIEEIV